MSTDINSVPRSWAGDVTVGAAALTDAAVTTAKLAANAVTAPKIGAGAVAGVAMSGTQRLKVSSSLVPTVPTAAGTSELLIICPYTGTVTAIEVAFKDALAADNTNYVTFAIKNKGQAGAGTTDVLSTAAVNTTKVTGGSALGAYTARILALNGTPANLLVNTGDVLAVQFVGAGTLANTLTEGHVFVGVDVAG